MYGSITIQIASNMWTLGFAVILWTYITVHNTGYTDYNLYMHLCLFYTIPEICVIVVECGDHLVGDSKLETEGFTSRALN